MLPKGTQTTRSRWQATRRLLNKSEGTVERNPPHMQSGGHTCARSAACVRLSCQGSCSAPRNAARYISPAYAKRRARPARSAACVRLSYQDSCPVPRNAARYISTEWVISREKSLWYLRWQNALSHSP